MALSRATPRAPSTPTFIRLARNRSLRANVMWTSPLVKIVRRIAADASYRDSRRAVGVSP